MEQFALAVISLMHTCMGSRRSRGLSVAAIWNHVGESVVRPLFSVYYYFSYFSASLPDYPPFCPHCYHSVTGTWMSLCVWGLMAGLQGLLAMGVFY